MSDYDRRITSISARRHRAAVRQLVNQERVRHGLRPLVLSAQLTISARSWAIFTAGRFGRLTHGNFPRRALRFPFVLAGKPGRRFVGENIAFASGELTTPRAIVALWMKSPGHRANILRNWTQGAVWSSPNGDAVAVVQHFGRSAR